MAKVIEFYFPTQHHPERKWMPEDLRGKMLGFPAPKPAKTDMYQWLTNAALWPLQPWIAPEAPPAASASPAKPLARTAE